MINKGINMKTKINLNRRINSIKTRHKSHLKDYHHRREESKAEVRYKIMENTMRGYFNYSI